MKPEKTEEKSYSLIIMNRDFFVNKISEKL